MEKLTELPKPWAMLQRRSAGQLLRAEAKTIGLLQRAIRLQVSQVVANLYEVPDADTAFLKRRAIAAIRHAVPMVGAAAQEAIRQGREHGREAAYNQVLTELKQVRVELRMAGVDESEHPKDPPAAEDPEGQDDLAAHTAATSLASAWGSRALAKVLAWESDPNGSLAADIHRTIPELDKKTRMIATTETARAFNDEHDEGVGYVAEQHEANTWLAGLFKTWSAILDRKTCAVCAAHDGEIVVAGMSFDGGDEPGAVHPCCRCTQTMMIIPAMIPGRTTPGHYEGLEDDDAA